jgi:hypothetical protein
MQPDMNKWRQPFTKDGKPMFDTRGLSGDDIKLGFEVFKRISPNGDRPKDAPFDEKTGKANFNTQGLSPQ